MLHHHGAHRRVGKQPSDLRPGTVHPGPDLGLDAGHATPAYSRPLGKPGHLPVKVGPLVMRGHPGVEAETVGCHSSRGVDEDHPCVDLSCRHGQRPVAVPAVGGLRMHTIRTRPVRQLHNTNPSTTTYTCSLPTASTTANSSAPRRCARHDREQDLRWAQPARGVPSTSPPTPTARHHSEMSYGTEGNFLRSGGAADQARWLTDIVRLDIRVSDPTKR